jgi:hypothetical protein
MQADEKRKWATHNDPLCKGALLEWWQVGRYQAAELCERDLVKMETGDLVASLPGTSRLGPSSAAFSPAELIVEI